MRAILLPAVFYVMFASAALGHTYYLSPTGQDDAAGRAPGEAWATFGRAFQALEPGDTLILADGVYRQSLAPNRSGSEGKPITIRARNDGAATIDGEFERHPVWIDRDYIVLEGLVGRGGREGVFQIVKGSHNVLRRCTGYDANPDGNSSVFSVAYPEAQHNLLEDCAASGTGRKMFIFFRSSHNTMRRCFANWQRWDGRTNPKQTWPNGSNLQFYGANHCIMENCIGYGAIPAWWSVSMFSQANTESCIGNRILGTIAVRAGMSNDGTMKEWGERPAPPTFSGVPEGFRPPGLHVGTSADKPNRDNVFRDCFSWGNAGAGLSVSGPVKNCVIDHVTLKGNRYKNLVVHPKAEVAITDSFIEGTEHQGEGARLTHRYVDGKLTDEPLWPWPMEERIKKEMDITVTQEMAELLDIEAPR